MNEASVVGNVIEGLVARGFAVLLVNDGSHDETARVAADAGATVISHYVNVGQGASLETGFEAIRRGQFSRPLVATFDADGQHSINSLEQMIEAFNADPDLEIVLGSRFLRDASQVPLAKRVLLQLAALIGRFTIGIRLTDRNNGMRLIKSTALSKLSITVPGYGHADEILRQISKRHIRYREVPVEIIYTEYSKAKGQQLINAVCILFDQLLNKS